MLPPDARRRVVVTGLGICTPLGSSVDLVWKKLLLGRSGIQSLPDRPGFKDLPSQVAGFVPVGSEPGDLDIDKHVTAAEQRTMSRDAVISLCVTKDALKDARWMPEDRTEHGDVVSGVSIASVGGSSVADFAEADELLKNGKYKRISPYLIPKLLLNMASGHMSIRFRLKGPNHCVSTACCSGLHSIGDSAHMIVRGACDVMVAGAVDFSLYPTLLAGLCRAKAVSTRFNKEPEKASRPFDARRDGFVPSEGAGVVILEELEHAKRRNASIYAEVFGYGMSSDAHHITSPSENGEGAVRAMREALRDAGVTPDLVGHVNAHSTSTPVGDLVEAKAIKQVLGDSDALVYAPKGALGHSLAASGTIETILTILAVARGVVPPNLNLEEPSSDISLNYVMGGATDWPRRNGLPRVAMTNSFGFGGTNGTLCIKEYI